MAIDVRVSNAWHEMKSSSVRIGGAWRSVDSVYQRRAGVWEKVWPTSYVAVSPDNNDLSYYWVFGTTWWGGWTQGQGISVEDESGSSGYQYYVGDDEQALGHPPIKTQNLVTDLTSLDDYNSIALTYKNTYSSESNHVLFYIMFCNSSTSYAYNQHIYWDFSSASGSNRLPPTEATYTMSITDTQKSNFKTYIASYPYVRFGVEIYYNISYSETQERDRVQLRGGTVESVILQA